MLKQLLCHHKPLYVGNGETITSYCSLCNKQFKDKHIHNGWLRNVIDGGYIPFIILFFIIILFIPTELIFGIDIAIISIFVELLILLISFIMIVG